MENEHAKGKGVTDHRKDSLFSMVNTSKTGAIDRSEFNSLYDVLKIEVKEEHEKEHKLEKVAEDAVRRTKTFAILALVMAIFLGTSVAANFGVIFAVVDGKITTKTESDGTMKTKDGKTVKVGLTDMTVSSNDALVAADKNVIETADAVTYLPLITLPVLPLSALNKVRNIALSYTKEFNGTTYDVSSIFTITEVRKYNDTFVELFTSRGDATITMIQGYAWLLPGGGWFAENKYDVDFEPIQICAQDVECSSLKIDEFNGNMNDLIDIAHEKLEASNGCTQQKRQLQEAYAGGKRQLGFSWYCGICQLYAAFGRCSNDINFGVWFCFNLFANDGAALLDLYGTGTSSTHNKAYFKCKDDINFGFCWNLYENNQAALLDLYGTGTSSTHNKAYFKCKDDKDHSYCWNLYENNQATLLIKYGDVTRPSGSMMG